MGCRCVGLALWLAALPGTAAAAPGAAVHAQAHNIPFDGYVVDRAHMLDAAARRALTDRLGRFQRRTHHQIAVATVDSLGGEDIATFATKLANRWGVGRRGYDDGVLLLIAPNQHGTRIAVGYGLEHRLTDRFCASVSNGVVIPAFRQGRFAAGIDAGVPAIIARLDATDQRDPKGSRR